MNFDNLTTHAVKESLAFAARDKAQRKAIQDYPAVLDVLLSINRALLVDDHDYRGIPTAFVIQLPPGYDVDKNCHALAVFGWAVRPGGQVIDIWN